MTTTLESRARSALLPLALFLACVLLQPACGGDGAGPRAGLAPAAQHAGKQPTDGPSPAPSLAPPDVSCPVHDAKALPAPPPRAGTAAVGAVPGAFSVTSTGEATYTIPIVVPPGRAGMEPRLALSYSSAAGEGVLGMGFTVSGLSAITRCPQTIVDDGRVRGVRDAPDDALCLDGKRLVAVGHGRGTVEYRTFPDTFTKVVAHLATGMFAAGQPLWFDVYTRAGLRLEYGTTADSKVHGRGGVSRAWWIAKSADRLGNFIAYSYRNDTDPDDGHTVEHVPAEIRYTGFEGSRTLTPSRAVRFRYDEKEPSHVRTSYVRGMAVKDSLRLSSIETFGPGHALVREYRFGHGFGPSTGRMLLTDVRECAADHTCKPPTRFWYRGGQPGFAPNKTAIAVPYAAKASPMLLDATGDGLDDIVVPDLVDANDPASAAHIGADGVVSTYWNLAASRGALAPKVFGPAASARRSDSLAGDLPADTTRIQPELGTALDYDQDGRVDVFLHDVHGNDATWFVLLARPDHTFERHDTGIARPLLPHAQASDAQGAVFTQIPDLRSKNGSVHIADVDGDGMPDFIQCENASPTAMGAADYRWALHRWSPDVPGWAPVGKEIELLHGYPCDTELHTVDVDADGRIDLLVPGAHRVGEQLSFHATYAALSWDGEGAWESAETGLPSSPQGLLLFIDVNGDGLPDAIASDQAHQLVTFFNTGRGFAAKVSSLPSPVAGGADHFFRLAATIDYNGDGRRDLLIPMPPGVLPNGSASVPSWVVLQATGSVSGPTFTIVDPHIPFEPSLGAEGIALADPRGPRVGDVNGDGAQDVVMALGGHYTAFEGLAADQDLLTMVADGMNDREIDTPGFVPSVFVAYDHLTDGAVTAGLKVGSAEREKVGYIARHDLGNGCDYPVHCVAGSRRVVQSYGLDTGADRLRRLAIKYRDGRFHRLGRGFLGFGERIVRDLDTGAGTIERHDNVTYDPDLKAFPYAGHVVREERYAPGSSGHPNPLVVEMSFDDVTFETVPTNGGRTYYTLPRVHHTRREQGVLPSPKLPGATLDAYARHVAETDDAALLSESWTTIWAHDDFGNILAESNVTDGVDMLVHVERKVTNDTERWLLGQVDEQRACSSTTGESRCRVTHRWYDGAGLLREESTSSDDPDPGARAETKLTVSFGRDAYGNVVGTVAVDGFGDRRSSCTRYEAEGVFPWAYGNGAGHVTYMGYDAGLGVPAVVVDPNGLVTRWAHDGFGRVVEETRPDGNKTTYTRTAGDPSKPDGFAVALETRVDGGADEVTQYDRLGRAIRWLSEAPRPAPSRAGAFTGITHTARVVQEIEYDALGEHVARRSLPYPELTPPEKRLYHRYTYDGPGRVVAHTAPWGAETAYRYDGRTVVTVAPGNAITITYNDPLGRPVSIIDSEKGETSYEYGPFGALRSARDPGGAVTVMHRDAYGRVRTLFEPDRGTSTSTYNGFGELVSTIDALGRATTFEYDALGRKLRREDADGLTTWTWDQADAAHKGIGRLASIESPGGHRETFTYDALSRPESTTLTVAGPSGVESFTSKIGYDSFGRAATIAYPSEADQPPFAVVHDYDPHGHLTAVRDAITGKPYWRLTGVDAVGRTRQETFGNGVETTRTHHPTKGLVSSIDTIGPEVVQDLTYAYDDRLNLTLRRSLRPDRVPRWERFTYDALDRLRCVKTYGTEGCALSYDYDASGNVTAKSDVGTYHYDDPAHPHAITSVTGLLPATYEYDAAGNQTARAGVPVTYTAFDLPKTIGGVTLEYDGAERRIRKTTADAETIYVGEMFERVTPMAGGPVERRYYIRSPERVVAVVTRVGAAPGAPLYLHTDNLGSVDAITDATGKVVERRSYDAFGARRGPAWSAPPAAFSPVTTKGFTGHEGDEELGLVNMKGRVYDPKLGRFLTPDPIVSAPYFGQSWNPYSYVLNNPLKYVDPSGFQEAPMVPGQPVLSVCVGRCDDTPPEPPEKDEKEADVSQSMAAGAARAPNDTGTVGTTSGGGPAQPPAERDALTRAGAITTGIAKGIAYLAISLVTDVCPPCRGYSEGGVLGALQVLNPFAGMSQSYEAVKAASERGDDEAAAAAAVPLVLGTAGVVLGGTALAEGAVGALESGAGRTALPEGSFSITDWKGYPEGVPRPTGPFRILTGDEYIAARAAANEANAAIRAGTPGLNGSGMHIHEIHPVKFGGSPTDPANKMLLPTAEHVGPNGIHAQFWDPLLRRIEGG
ncbi:MAG: FG-GAP-like repeat-containing protein [Minicystis sp.]